MYNYRAKKVTLQFPNGSIHLLDPSGSTHAENFVCLSQNGNMSAQATLQVTLARRALDLGCIHILLNGHLFGAHIDGQP